MKLLRKLNCANKTLEFHPAKDGNYSCNLFTFCSWHGCLQEVVDGRAMGRVSIVICILVFKTFHIFDEVKKNLDILEVGSNGIYSVIDWQ